ncbi:hypothetical protein N7G274_001654 [Stereocaulon virgatum]|uniref:Uncharacterized protein n=1 Tax=Stereocaulon virgatum TaxID=373712 RepID=A0ABR4AKB1_9LECA
MRFCKASNFGFVSQWCTFVFAVSAPPTDPAPVSPISVDVRSTRPFTLSFPAPRNITLLPPEPFNYPVPASHQTLIFSGYGPPLMDNDTFLCLLIAASDVIRVLNSGRDMPVLVRDLVYAVEGVHLEIWSMGTLTWGMVGTTITGLKDFLYDYESIHVEFSIEEQGIQGLVGRGLLTRF